MEVLLFLFVAAAAVVGGLVLFLKLLLGLVLLPFKILIGLLKGLGGIVGALSGVLMGLAGVVAAVVLVPLVPLLLLGGVIWLGVRAARSTRPQAIPAEARLLR